MCETVLKTLADIQAVILAGGKGTRLKSVVSDVPKPLAVVSGRPFIDWVLIGLAQARARRVILCTGYLASMLREFVRDGRRWGLEVLHSEEPEPLGTAGALRYALHLIESELVLVLNGDSWCFSNLDSFLQWHLSRHSRASVLLTQVNDCSRFGSVEVDGTSKIRRFVEKPPRAGPGWINAGVYLIDRMHIAGIEPGRPASMECDLFPSMIDKGLYGYRTSGRFIDIGTPESFASAHALFVSSKEATRLRLA